MQSSRRTFSAALAAGVASLATPPLLAQTGTAFPARVIRIVPFGTAGGPIDVLARVYGEKLQQRWNQSVIVDAKPGASGIIAAEFVAKERSERSNGFVWIHHRDANLRRAISGRRGAKHVLRPAGRRCAREMGGDDGSCP